MRTKFKAWTVPYLSEHPEVMVFVDQIPEIKDIYLEIGSGKGMFLVNMAKKFPDRRFIGIERNVTCAGYIAKKLVDEEIDNVLVNVYKEIDLLETKIKDLSKELKLDFNLQKPDVLKNSYLYIIKTKEYLEELKEKAKELSKLMMKQQKESTVSLDDYVSQMVDIKDVKTLVCKVDASSGLDVNKLKDLSDRLADKVGKCVIVLALVNNDKIVFVVKSKVSEVNAGMIAKLAANITGGNGGGRPDFAQSGGRDVTKLDEANKVVNQELEKLI